ncbi:MAG: hypothetical protein MI717_15565 [Spirochaetales bacterium]|nr:hypothetical protein [Spirochaetales bacterium]
MKRIGVMILLVLSLTVSSFAFDGYVDITNDTGLDLYSILVRPEGDFDWGEDRLGDSILGDGNTVRIPLTNAPSSYFDILLEDEDGDTYTYLEFDISTGDIIVTLDDIDYDDVYGLEVTSWGPGGKFEGYVDITNETGFTLYFIQVSHKNTDSWGDDLLGDAILENGKTLTVNLVDYPNSRFDIRLEDEDGDTYTFWDVDVSSSDLYVTLDQLDY